MVILSFGTAQALRFGSNLVLTRLLFPEAFGLMAIVSVVLSGMNMFSNMGTGPSIMRSPRGDDPLFLDTAWVLQIGRGFVLWLVALAGARPLAAFYNEPSLAWLLPLAAIALLFEGIRSTRLETENRHLRMGRIMSIDVAAQAVTFLAGIILAAIYREVWTLPVAGILGSATRFLLSWTILPGHANRLRFDRTAASELVGFGKWIFFSTIAGFFVMQSDRLVLGTFLSMGSLGIYNIGYFLGSFVSLAAGMVCTRMLMPFYRETMANSTSEGTRKIQRLRALFTATMFLPVAMLAAFGVPITELLFDPRFANAGIVAALLACVQIPHLIIMTYDQAALAAGDSRNFFLLVLARAILQISGLIIGIQLGGLAGAIAGQGAAVVLSYVPVVWLARKHGVYDLRHDLAFTVIGLVIVAAALWINSDGIASLATM